MSSTPTQRQRRYLEASGVLVLDVSGRDLGRALALTYTPGWSAPAPRPSAGVRAAAARAVEDLKRLEREGRL